MKLLNRCKSTRRQVCTTDDNKYNCYPHPCTSTTLYCRSKSQLAMTLMVSITISGETVQGSSDAWVWLIIYIVIFALQLILFVAHMVCFFVKHNLHVTKYMKSMGCSLCQN